MYIPQLKIYGPSNRVNCIHIACKTDRKYKFILNTTEVYNLDAHLPVYSGANSADGSVCL